MPHMHAARVPRSPARSPRPVQAGASQPARLPAGQPDALALQAGLPAPSTGLPDTLKAGLASLSGLCLDAVQLYRNSPLPAQLGALASTQGLAIHLGPGQDRHLPHEAWHVVQQAQGRVQGGQAWLGGHLLNDDPALEHEADAMGARAAALGASLPPGQAVGLQAPPPQAAAGPVQLLDVNTKNRNQIDKLRQRYVAAVGHERGWKDLLSAARSLVALESQVEALESPEPTEPGEEKAKVDKHGGKHLRGRKKGEDTRTMIEKSKTKPATFYPKVDYEALLQQVVKAAVAAGARFCEIGHAVGVDQGAETSLVELYGGADIGYHMRPKNPDYIKKYREQTIASLEQTGTASKEEEDGPDKPSARGPEKSGSRPGPSGAKPAVRGGVPVVIEGVGQLVNVSGRGMNCLIRALYRAVGADVNDGQLVIIRDHLVQQGVAQGGNMLDIVGEAGAHLVSYLVAQQVLPGNRGINVYTPDHLAVPHQILNGANPINLWLSGNHFRAIV